MRFDFTDAETDYLYRLLLARPMGEVESMVVRMRRQIAEAQQVTPQSESPAAGASGAVVRPNGAGEGVDSPGLP